MFTLSVQFQQFISLIGRHIHLLMRKIVVFPPYKFNPHKNFIILLFVHQCYKLTIRIVQYSFYTYQKTMF